VPIYNWDTEEEEEEDLVAEDPLSCNVTEVSSTGVVKIRFDSNI